MQTIVESVERPETLRCGIKTLAASVMSKCAHSNICLDGLREGVTFTLNPSFVLCYGRW